MINIKKSKIRDVKFGKNCKIIEPVNLYECSLGNNTFVGPFVEIGKNVIIGDNTRISSHSYICELVTIGDDCFIGHGVMFTNDLFKNGKLGGSVKNWKKTYVGNNVLIGSNSTILPVQISDGCVIGAGSVVTKNCAEPGIYAGNPAVLIRSLKNEKKNK
ncbi:acyltransferase [Pelagibacteraceae bacterium]|nr:acyltransferase [Pelagibacteraceae bacterium]